VTIRRVKVNHSAAAAETVNHHRLPRLAATTLHVSARTCNIRPMTTVSRPFMPISLVSAKAEGTTEAREISAATPHPIDPMSEAMSRVCSATTCSSDDGSKTAARLGPALPSVHPHSRSHARLSTGTGHGSSSRLVQNQDKPTTHRARSYAVAAAAKTLRHTRARKCALSSRQPIRILRTAER